MPQCAADSMDRAEGNINEGLDFSMGLHRVRVDAEAVLKFDGVEVSATKIHHADNDAGSRSKSRSSLPAWLAESKVSVCVYVQAHAASFRGDVMLYVRWCWTRSTQQQQRVAARWRNFLAYSTQDVPWIIVSLVSLLSSSHHLFEELSEKDFISCVGRRMST